MTIYGTDQSHYDGTITTSWVKKAMAEGISFFTHKLGEGTGGEDTQAKSAMAAYRAAGVEMMGTYWVVRSGAVGPQADAYFKYLNKDVPWWKDEPYFFHQVDLELWSYDRVPAQTGIDFGNELQSRVSNVVTMYASHGQYGNKLVGWKGPLWNANYGTTGNGPSKPFKSLYPGPNDDGWDVYSGQKPKLLQYTSNALIAGLTTSDASAFEGTVDDMKNMITQGAHMDLTPQNLADIADAVWDTAQVTYPPNYSNPGAKVSASGSLSSIMQYNYEDTVNGRATQKDLDALSAEVTAQGAKLDQILALLQAGNGGTTTGDFTVTGTLHVEGQ